MGIEYLTDKKCRLVVYCGSDAYGKPIRRTKTVTYTSERNAEKQYRKFEHEVEDGLKRDPTVRVSEIIDDYIASRKRKGMKAMTINGYEIIKTRIEETLGDPIAAKVNRKMVDDWIAKLSEKYSPKTIRNTVSLLSSCYERSIDLEQLHRNPCRNAEIPERKKKPKVTLTEDTLMPFVAELRTKMNEDPDFVVAVELMLFCGLRRSEVLGLKLESINEADKTIHIERARHTLHGDYIEDGTKTEESNSVLSLPGFVFNDVMKLISIHEENARRDKNLPSSDYLILNALHEPLHPNTLYFKLVSFDEKHGFPRVTPHGLRHTYASMLKWLGRDMVEVQRQMRHSQLSTTLDIYTHLFQNAGSVSKGVASDLDELVKTSVNFSVK